MIDRRRVVFAGLLAAPLLLLASCKDDGGGFGFSGAATGGGGAAASAAPSAATVEPNSPTSASAPSSSSGDLAVLGGVWSGTYHCAQGATKMRLTMVAAGSQLTGTFEFSSSDGSGSYTITGERSGSSVVLRGDQWLQQPSGYVMVNFTITEISASTLSGTIDGSGCSTFRVTKA